MKIYLRIIAKPYAHFQTITKTPVNFQKDRQRTVGVDAHTRYLLLLQKAENYVPSLFFEKAEDKKKYLQERSFFCPILQKRQHNSKAKIDTLLTAKFL